MTPALFFRLVAWFALVVACLMGGLAVVALLNGNVLPGTLLLALAIINAAGWRLFHSWSNRKPE